MSLVIDAAGAIGTGVTELIFDYNKSDYEAKINELEGLVNRLEGHLSTLKNLRANVPSFWDDDDGRKACTALDKTINQTVLQMDHAKSLMRVYKETVAEFDTNKNKVVDLMEGAIGILNALDAIF